MMKKLRRIWYHIWDFMKYNYKEWDKSLESRLTYDGELEKKVEERIEKWRENVIELEKKEEIKEKKGFKTRRR